MTSWRALVSQIGDSAPQSCSGQSRFTDSGSLRPPLDVLKALPVHLVEALEPWDLEGMRPYTPDYLGGFAAELYQVPVDRGFEHGQAVMRETIAMDVRADIGGDQQLIQRMEVEHADTTFKHVLLPVWIAAFTFIGRQYRFVVNGRTGEVHGERPWSAWKIAGAVVLAILLFLVLALFFSQAESLQQGLRHLG